MPTGVELLITPSEESEANDWGVSECRNKPTPKGVELNN
ncbi:hypothetical protein M2137_002949 [Parabacteroides sp. PFB2-10]|nr:hypothetical protein [Parabacteroides sp. PFB2-10]MDH6314155.1 hypothetical protein [Parabacteroides sp. PFB2-10]